MKIEHGRKCKIRIDAKGFDILHSTPVVELKFLGKPELHVYDPDSSARTPAYIMLDEVGPSWSPPKP